MPTVKFYLAPWVCCRL